MSINSKHVSKDKLDFYNKLIRTNPNIERKGKTMPYTSHNGHMFSYLSPEGSMGLRLPDKYREDFMKKYNTVLDKPNLTASYHSTFPARKALSKSPR